jgi:hypothetical protein
MTRDSDWLHDAYDALDRVLHLGAVSELGVRVRWGRFRKNKTQFLYATYDFDKKLIELNPVLKGDWIPEVVVYDTIAHEMLHALRGFDHDVEFARAEARYPYHTDSAWWCEHNNDRLIAAEPPKKESK